MRLLVVVVVMSTAHRHRDVRLGVAGRLDLVEQIVGRRVIVPVVVVVVVAAACQMMMLMMKMIVLLVMRRADDFLVNTVQVVVATGARRLVDVHVLVIAERLVGGVGGGRLALVVEPELSEYARVLDGQVGDAVDEAHLAASQMRLRVIRGRIAAEHALLDHLADGDRARPLVLDDHVLGRRLRCRLTHFLHNYGSLDGLVWQPFFALIFAKRVYSLVSILVQLINE